jgi:hypothetical protein
LIEKTVMAKTEDQYPFTTVYYQELSFFSNKSIIEDKIDFEWLNEGFFVDRHVEVSPHRGWQGAHGSSAVLSIGKVTMMITICMKESLIA